MYTKVPYNTRVGFIVQAAVKLISCLNLQAFNNGRLLWFASSDEPE